MMMTRMAKKTHIGNYDTARPDDLEPGKEEGGGVNHTSRVGGWRMELERVEGVGGMEDETKTLNQVSP